MKVSWTYETNDLYRAILSHNEIDLVQIECPVPFTKVHHSTIFWRGRTSTGYLHEFVNASFQPRTESLGTLFFFPHFKLRLPAHTTTTIPSFLEGALTGAYGDPTFVRYEVYPKDVVTEDLSQTRYSLWGSVTPPQQWRDKKFDHEIGFFTVLGCLRDKAIQEALQTLLKNTIKETVDDRLSEDLVESTYEVLAGKLSK